jgi:hypothetical protein
MSFLEDVWRGITTAAGAVSGDEDALYPDNGARRLRVAEILNDIRNFQQEAVQSKGSLQRLLEIAANRYEDVLPMDNFDFKSWTAVAPQFLGEVLYLGSVFEASAVAGVLAIGDPVTQKQFIDVVDLPFDIKLIRIAGVPILPTSGILGGALSGSQKRDQLQQFIKELIPARVRMKGQAVLLQALVERLGFLGEADTLSILGYDKEEIDTIFKKKMEQVKTTVSAIREEDVEDVLRKLDEERNSWTPEG